MFSDHHPAVNRGCVPGRRLPLHPIGPIAAPPLSASPPSCCPDRFTSPAPKPNPPTRLLSLRLSVPEGRGGLRTKWRISRQLCAHTLRWPSIIHALPPLHHHHFLHLHSGLLICPRRLRCYLSYFFPPPHTATVSGSLHPCYPLI